MINVEKTCANLKRMREESGMSLWHFAKAVGVNYATAIAWETKNVPNVDNLFNIAGHYNCKIEDLVINE